MTTLNNNEDDGLLLLRLIACQQVGSHREIVYPTAHHWLLISAMHLALHFVMVTLGLILTTTALTPTFHPYAITCAVTLDWQKLSKMVGIYC